MAIDLGLLTTRIQAQGIPLDFIRSKDGTLAGIELIFLPEATALQQSDAQAIVNTYTDVDGTALADIQARWKTNALHDKTPAQIFTTMQSQIDGWTTLAQAKADLRVWLPLLFAGIAWTVFRDQQRD